MPNHLVFQVLSSKSKGKLILQGGIAPENVGSEPKLREQVRETLRRQHYSIRTEESCCDWIRQFIIFQNRPHPREMNTPEVTKFLSQLTVERNVAASTQNQAFSTPLFLHKKAFDLLHARTLLQIKRRDLTGFRFQDQDGAKFGSRDPKNDLPDADLPAAFGIVRNTFGLTPFFQDGPYFGESSSEFVFGHRIFEERAGGRDEGFVVPIADGVDDGAHPLLRRLYGPVRREGPRGGKDG